MLLFWRIRYYDAREKQFKDRDLWLDTDTLDPVTKAAIEAIHDLKDNGRSREILRYRHIFREQNRSSDELSSLCERHDRMSTVFIHDYFEDETGQELTSKQMAAALTGNPDAVLLPAGAKQYDIDYFLAEKRSISVDEITLTPRAYAR